MLTIRVMRNGAGYARKHLEQNDYYAEGEKVAGEWLGKGAEKLGLKGKVLSEQFERIRQGLHPETSEMLRQRRSPTKDGSKEVHPRSLYDGVFSLQKSLSVMAILGKDERLYGVHDRAVQEALLHMEQFAATRVRTNKQDTDRTTGNLIVAAYRHDSSRRLDPQIHTHCVMANMTYDPEEKRWKALQAGAIYARRAYLSEIYRNVVAREVQKLGYKIENREHGFEIVGIPQSLLDKFSQGSKEREAAVAEFIKKNGREPTDNEIAVLVRDSRPDKLIAISTAEVRKQQFARLTPEEARTLAQVREEADRNKTTVKTHSAEQSLQYALDHVFERVSVAPDYVVLTEALKHGRGHIQIGELVDCLRQRESKLDIIRAGDDIATRESVEREKEMVERVRNGRSKHDRMGKEVKDFKLDDLNAEQRRVVEFVLDSRDFAVNIDGAAGTGKTTALRALGRGLQAGGRLMAAVAPTTEAVKGLKKAGFQNALTIEGLLQNKELHPQLTGRAIIVDEAGMVSGRQMIELLRLAQRFDARIIFSGDTKQLQSVEASDALRILVDEKSIASIGLRKVQRQENREYRVAMQLLRRKPEKGFEMLETMGAIKQAGLFERAEAVAEAYRKTKGDTLVVCPTHEEIHRVTTAIRADLHTREKLGADHQMERLEPLNWTAAQKRDIQNFVPGQVLVFHKGTKEARKYAAFTILGQDGNTVTARNGEGNEIRLTKKQAKSFGVYERRNIDVAVGDWLSIQSNVRDETYQFTNGERVKVAKVNENGSIVLGDGRTLPHDFRQFNHGYAVTAHKSQGKTVDEVIISGDRFTKELFYVAASRGRHRITVFTGDKENLRESVGVSGERMSALELLRKQARTVDRTRTAERPRTLAEGVGKLLETLWLNIPRLIFGERYAPERQGVEMGGR